MNENDPRVSVVITAHAEKPHWLRRAILSVVTQIDAPDFELIIVLDKPEAATKQEAYENAPDMDNIHEVEFGDLGESRNFGASKARGKYVSFLDGDDLFGSRWLRQAYDYARGLDGELRKKATALVDSAAINAPTEIDALAESFVLHPEYNVFFGADQFMHLHTGDDSPEHDAKDMIQFNGWSALAFAPRSVFSRFPYMRAQGGWGFEDHQFNTDTLGAGVSHRVVPASAHMIRLKHDETSLGTRHVKKHLCIRRSPLFDRRDLPDFKSDRNQRRELPDELVSQITFAQRDVGERQIMLAPRMTIRQYPRQRAWADFAWLRDQIGEAKHVVLVDNMQKGGAEKYAIDWARANGAVLIETAPNEHGVWRARAAEAGVKVITWIPIAKPFSDDEKCIALQRALIQGDLASVLVCNSHIGWALVHQNSEAIARRVFAASFAPIPIGNGLEICPPYFMKSLAPNFAVITDNKAHAERMHEYNGVRVIVLPPKCDYAGQSKRKQIKTEKLRVLWAGRGSPEKNPGILPAIAAVLEDKADIHVWGDVKPMNGPENLKYRGPFDGFDKIDGTYDVYLITSLTEGCPNTAMEAVMADIPVVGPEIGALPELVTMHYRGDPMAIAQAIQHAPLKYTAGPKLTVTKWRDSFDADAKSIAENGDRTANESLVMPIETITREEAAAAFPQVTP